MCCVLILHNSHLQTTLEYKTRKSLKSLIVMYKKIMPKVVQIFDLISCQLVRVSRLQNPHNFNTLTLVLSIDCTFKKLFIFERKFIFFIAFRALKMEYFLCGYTLVWFLRT